MKKTLYYFLLISSAALYASAYLCPVYFWWTVLIFLIPFFYAVFQHKVSSMDIFIWASIAFSFQLSGVLEGLFILAEGPYVLRSITVFVAFLIPVVWSLFWFKIAAVVSAYKKEGWWNTSCWIVSTWVFFLWIEQACLFMLGIWEGYLLFNPVVLLVNFPALLFFLPKLGSVLFLLFFIVVQGLVALACRGSRPGLYSTVCLVSIWLLGAFCWYVQEKKVFDADGIVCGSATFPAHDTVVHNGRIIRNYCKELLAEYPAGRLLFFAEVAIKSPHLPSDPQVVKLLSKNELGKEVTLITGGFRWDHDNYRNTVYWIHDGQLVDLFDKRHAMALTERAPSEFFLGNSSLITETYFKNFVGIIPHNHPRPVWKITPELKIIPYICSELFFNNSPDHAPTDAIIVALCNDGWIMRDYMRYQMCMGARYRAIQWQIPVVYVAHFYQMYCDPSGDYQLLNVFNHNKSRSG